MSRRLDSARSASHKRFLMRLILRLLNVRSNAVFFPMASANRRANLTHMLEHRENEFLPLAASARPKNQMMQRLFGFTRVVRVCNDLLKKEMPPKSSSAAILQHTGRRRDVERHHFCLDEQITAGKGERESQKKHNSKKDEGLNTFRMTVVLREERKGHSSFQT